MMLMKCVAYTCSGSAAVNQDYYAYQVTPANAFFAVADVLCVILLVIWLCNTFVKL